MGGAPADVGEGHAAGGPSPPTRWPRRAAAVAGVAGLVVYVLAVGWLFDVIRFAAARLPALTTAGQVSVGALFSQGVASVALMLGVLVAGSAVALFSSRRKWDVHGPDWHDIVLRGVTDAANDRDALVEHERRERLHATQVARRAYRTERRLRSRNLSALAAVPAGVKGRALDRARGLHAGTPSPRPTAPLGDWAVRLVAGFNIMILSALVAVGVARAVDVLIPARPWTTLTTWLAVIVGAGVFLGVRWLLTTFSPLRLPARLHGLIWALVAVATLFASVPVGVLVITGVGVSTLGRTLARTSRPRTAAEWVRSPVLWSLLAVCTLLGASYSATPPVVLPQATVVTAAGRITGGYIGRSTAGVSLATCIGLADATSTQERLQFVPVRQVVSVRIGGGTDYLDSGERPSIVRLALHSLGLGADPPTLFSPGLRARRPTCARVGPAVLVNGVPDPALGAGVIAPAASATPRAGDDEAPIQSDRTTPGSLARLALAYQPTLLVSAADRNWPVSVNSILAERGPRGQPVCLVRSSGPRVCPPVAGELTGAGATSGDYLQLPVALGANRSPGGQFQAFLRGQDEVSGPLHEWLTDPSRLDPWHTAQIYFYDAGPMQRSSWPAKPLDPRLPAGLIAFEYWFYYPFNYYPVVVNSALMDGAPIAGDSDNVDLHQGDWEHVDVLLDPRTMKPAWLYMARHDSEGQFVLWSSPSLRWDGSHPVVQAAFGGHPSYLPGCGAGPRAITLNASSDWLSCGSGRFAFPAAMTPLVNIAAQPWRCWPGYFGEATRLEVSNARENGLESALDLIKHVVYVAGPRGPLQQAENHSKGVCARG